MASSHDDFFIGYSRKVPPRLMAFLAAVAGSLLVIAAVVAFALGAGTADPGNGRFIGGAANLKTLTGIVELQPYPILRVMPDGDQEARAIPLTGQGKWGVMNAAEPLDGQIVDIEGFFLRRGELDMLVVRGGVNNMKLTPTAATLTADQQNFTPAAAESLGYWRLEGEICDGKCYAGAMRPGNGLAHLACADLCLLGGVPPVFVTTGEIEGMNFMWLANADGGPLPDAYYDLVALRVSLEGEVERRDDILVFKVDLSSAEVF